MDMMSELESRYEELPELKKVSDIPDMITGFGQSQRLLLINITDEEGKSKDIIWVQDRYLAGGLFRRQVDQELYYFAKDQLRELGLEAKLEGSCAIEFDMSKKEIILGGMVYGHNVHTNFEPINLEIVVYILIKTYTDFKITMHLYVDHQDNTPAYQERIARANASIQKHNQSLKT